MEKAVVVVKLYYRPGPDSGTPAHFCFGEPDTALILLNLFTISLSIGVFLVQWKVSGTVPLHKN